VSLASLRFELALRRERLWPRYLAEDGSAWVRDRVGRRRYRRLTEADLLSTRTSDTVFVFGSGRSVLDISAEEWELIGRCNTLTFSEFHRQSFVRADYHMVGEVADEPGMDHEQGLREYARRLRENPLYRQCVLFLQEGWLARSSNELVGLRLLPAGARIFRYRRVNRGVYAAPTRSFRAGVTHGWNSSISATNIAILLGFRRIVLVGVDLYDRGYFWLDEGGRRDNVPTDAAVAQPFATAEAVVGLFRSWREVLERDGVELTVYNPRSLVADVLPVFDRRALLGGALASGG
jgi:hypothetical protein